MKLSGANESPERADPRELVAVLAVFLVARYSARALGVDLGGPLSTVIAVAVAFLLVKRAGGGWADMGVARPASLPRALAMFLVAFAATAAVGLVLMGYLTEVFGPPVSSGRFDYLRGNLPALVISVAGIAWLAAGIGEEVLFRGFLLPRLAALLGGGTGAWATAVILQAAFFAALHGGVIGATVAGAIGVAYGLVFWLGLRNVWPLVVAHAIPDTISLIGAFQGGH